MTSGIAINNQNGGSQWVSNQYTPSTLNKFYDLQNGISGTEGEEGGAVVRKSYIVLPCFLVCFRGPASEENQPDFALNRPYHKAGFPYAIPPASSQGAAR